MRKLTSELWWEEEFLLTRSVLAQSACTLKVRGRCAADAVGFSQMPQKIVLLSAHATIASRAQARPNWLRG